MALYRIIDLRLDPQEGEAGVEAKPFLLLGDQQRFPVHERYEDLRAARVRVVMLQRADLQNHR